jgi:hypothetical protein
MPKVEEFRHLYQGVHLKPSAIAPNIICINKYNFYLIKYEKSGIILFGTNLEA